MRVGMPAHFQSTDINALLIEFSGPNIPITLIGKALNLLTRSNSPPTSGLVSAKAIFRQQEYHEAPSSKYGGEDAPSADISIAFNAGIWGYDSWNPTVAYMCTKKPDVTTRVSYHRKVM